LASKKNNKANGGIIIVTLVLAPFFWLYEYLGKTIFFSLVICVLAWFCFSLYKKRKQRLIEEKHPVIHVRAATPSQSTVQSYQTSEPQYTHQQFMNDSTKFYKEFIDECWNTINNPTPHPDVYRVRNLYFMQHPMCDRHAECIRCLQIIRNSIDIVMESSKEQTIVSRMGVIAECYEELQELQHIFTNSHDYNRIHMRFAELTKQIHTTTYLNIAQGHAKKMESVKTDKTKAKYLGLAIETLELGLSDPDAQHQVLQELIDKFKSYDLYDLVQNKMQK
jgi:hypothetical protein